MAPSSPWGGEQWEDFGSPKTREFSAQVGAVFLAQVFVASL